MDGRLTPGATTIIAYHPRRNEPKGNTQNARFRKQDLDTVPNWANFARPTHVAIRIASLTKTNWLDPL